MRKHRGSLISMSAGRNNDFEKELISCGPCDLNAWPERAFATLMIAYHLSIIVSMVCALSFQMSVAGYVTLLESLSKVSGIFLTGILMSMGFCKLYGWPIKRMREKSQTQMNAVTI